MKKLLAITMMLILAKNLNAQDVYSVGSYNMNNGTIAALYKNGNRLYTAHISNQTSKATRVTCNSRGDAFWLVNFYDYPDGTYNHTEIRLNDHVYASNENHREVHIADMYCLNDTVYYAGYQYNEDSVLMATVWKGSEFETHWIMGDGIHSSLIYNVDIDKRTGIPYFCGYVIDGKKKASVWKEQELLFTYDQDTINGSYITYTRATQIAVDNGHVYTIGEFEPQGWSGISAIWKDNEMLGYGGQYEFIYHAVCALDNSFYSACSDRWGDDISKDFQTQMLRIGYAYQIFSTNTDIYVIGMDFDYNFYIWKNFEKECQIEDCEYIFDMTVVETSNPPDNYYGYLCQPDSAILYLNSNHVGQGYDRLYAGFRYQPTGLLEASYVESYEDYAHWMHYYYDADLHVIRENDSYFDPGANPSHKYYTYENGLKIAYANYYDDYHEQGLVLADSISYAYDASRRLQIEQRFIYATTVKNYEYLENKVIINTTDYSSGEWRSRETRTFNEDSLLVSSQTEKYNDSTVLVTYGYDEQGHRTSILTQKRNNGVWENQKLVLYHFNPYGRLTLAEIKLWQDDTFVDAHRAVYELNEMGYPATVTFEKWEGETWGEGVWQSDFYLYDEAHLKQQNSMLYKERNSISKIDLVYKVTGNPREPFLPDNSEWFYEIINDNGSITNQHLEYASDTVIGTERPKIIVRTNTIYDRGVITEMTHEYVYEENGIVYWWNKDLQEFTVLYDYNAEVGDQWEIKVGHEGLIMHVDAVESVEYEGRIFRMLHVSDENDFFCGNIVCGIGHLTSFFPERLMNRDKGYRVTGLRCYWVEGNLIFKINRDDCDAIYAELHNGINEDGPSTGSGTFMVYPNPANNILFVETVCTPSLPDQTAYRITNLIGQTLLQGRISAETQQIDISILPEGMYFISVGETTLKFVKR